MDVKTLDHRIKTAMNGVRQAFRGKVKNVNSADGVQRLQIEGLADETVQNLEHAEQFGFTGNPPVDSDCVVVPLGGKTSHGIIVTTTNGAYRVTGLAPGETAVYNQDGAKIVLKAGKVIEIECATLNINATEGVNITSPEVKASAIVTAEGQINGNGGMAIQGGRGTTFNGDIHQVAGDYKTDGDLVAGDISVRKHHHDGDSGGQTGPAKP